MKLSHLAAPLLLVAGAAFAQVDPKLLPDTLVGVGANGMSVDKQFSAAGGFTGWVLTERAGSGGRQFIAYTTADGKYLFAGNLMDASGRNLTKQYEDDHFTRPDHSKAWAELEKLALVKEGPADKDAKSFIYVFTDPGCPYCQKAWALLQPFMAKGLQVRWVTVGILGPSSASKAAAILSARDPLEAHRRHNETFVASRGIAGIEVTADMRRVLKKHGDLMQELGLNGTPGVVYRDPKGRVNTLAGLPTAQTLEQILSAR